MRLHRNIYGPCRKEGGSQSEIRACKLVASAPKKLRISTSLHRKPQTPHLFPFLSTNCLESEWISCARVINAISTVNANTLLSSLQEVCNCVTVAEFERRESRTARGNRKFPTYHAVGSSALGNMVYVLTCELAKADSVTLGVVLQKYPKTEPFNSYDQESSVENRDNSL